MDATLGITGDTIDDLNPISGLSISLSGGTAATTFNSLPGLFDQWLRRLTDNSVWGRHLRCHQHDDKFGLQLHKPRKYSKTYRIRLCSRHNVVRHRIRKLPVLVVYPDPYHES